jgi:hypothetical protein
VNHRSFCLFKNLFPERPWCEDTAGSIGGGA